jgi:hypothetical protein
MASKTSSSFFESHNLTQIDDHFFANVYSRDWSMILALTVSILNILVLTPLMGYIIWHEKNGSDHNRWANTIYNPQRANSVKAV